MRAAIYARVSTMDQEPENQLVELRRYADVRSWTATEYVDHGVSGARESRPALDKLLKDARRRRFDVVIVWRLDRISRSLRHLILMLDEFAALGIAFISLTETIDTASPAGRLSMQVIGAVAEYERSLIRERVLAGIARAKADGVKLGRPKIRVPDYRLEQVQGLSIREAAKQLGVSAATANRLLRRVATSKKTGNRPCAEASVGSAGVQKGTANKSGGG